MPDQAMVVYTTSIEDKEPERWYLDDGNYGTEK